MQLEKELAKILAREVAYRSYRRYGTQGLLITRRVEPSVWRSNILMAIILSFISIFTGLVPLLGVGRLNPNVAFAFSSVIMIFFEALMAIFVVTSFTSVFMAERITESLSILPLTEKDVFKAYFRALLLYWGGLAPIFAFIPGAILGFVTTLYKHMTLVLPVLLCFAGFLIMLFSYSLGIALGSYARKVRKKVSLRALSTIGWLIVFAFFYSWNYIVRYILENITAETVMWVSLLPFVGIFFGYENSYMLLISTAETVIILAITLKWAIARLKVIIGLASITLITPAKLPVKEKVEVKAIKFKVKPAPLQFIIKDLTLLSRDPRRLANILYFVVIQILAILPVLTSEPRKWSMVDTMVSALFIVMLSILPGITVDIIYYVEGESAKVLYYMPIFRRKLAFYKAMSAVPFALLSSLIISAIIAYISNNATLGVLIFFATLICSPFIALLFSSITMHMLPESPSAWSEASVSRRLLTIVKLVVFIGLIIIAIVSSFLLIPIFGEIAPLVVLLAYLAITSVAGTIAYLSIPKYKPL